MVGKDGSATLFGRCRRQLLLQVVAVEDVVPSTSAQGSDPINSSPRIKACANRPDLAAPCTAKFRPHWLPSPSSCSKRGILRRADDQNIANPRQHQGAERVVDHRLIIDGQQLLAHRHGDWIETGARTTGQNNAFTFGHDACFLFLNCKEKGGLRPHLPVLSLPARDTLNTSLTSDLLAEDLGQHPLHTDCPVRQHQIEGALEFTSIKAGVMGRLAGVGKALVGTALSCVTASSTPASLALANTSWA